MFRTNLEILWHLFVNLDLIHLGDDVNYIRITKRFDLIRNSMYNME